MGGIDERNAHRIAHSERNLCGIGEMGVNDVRQARATAKVGDQRAGEGGAITRQRFLGKIGSVAAVDARNPQFGGQDFMGLCVN